MADQELPCPGILLGRIKPFTQTPFSTEGENLLKGEITEFTGRVAGLVHIVIKFSTKFTWRPIHQQGARDVERTKDLSDKRPLLHALMKPGHEIRKMTWYFLGHPLSVTEYCESIPSPLDELVKMRDGPARPSAYGLILAHEAHGQAGQKGPGLRCY
jgi:hypothetical protein